MLLAAWNVLVQLAPWLLLGAFIAGALHALLPAGFVRRRLQGGWGVLKAVALGVPLPLCSCGVIPAGIGLKKDGASNGAALGFLISTPQTGVDSVLVSASFLGWPFALFKVGTAAVTGMVGGLLADRLSDPVAVTQAPSCGSQRQQNQGVIRRVLDHGLETIRSIWVWLLVGVLVSAAIESWVPPAVFQQVAGWGSLPAALVALAVSLPLYVCATASVPIAASLVAGGLPAGAALVFLMAGPATNVTTIGSIHRTFGMRTTLVYLSTVILGSAGFAMLFDWWMPLEALQQQMHHHHGPAWVGISGAIVVLGLMGWFACQDAHRWWRKRHRPASSEPEIRIAVEGMRCEDCVRKLEQALLASDGVEQAEVRLQPGEAIVHASAELPRLHEVIEQAGFHVAR